MKRKYESPMVYEESFVANEYVAACYSLACERESNPALYIATNWSTPEFGSDITHAKGYKKNSCTDPQANRIFSDTGLLKDAEVGEYNWHDGWITGGIDKWIDSEPKGKINDGDIVYWHTFSPDKQRRWNHVGTVKNVDSSHPNHS